MPAFSPIGNSSAGKSPVCIYNLLSHMRQKVVLRKGAVPRFVHPQFILTDWTRDRSVAETVRIHERERDDRGLPPFAPAARWSVIYPQAVEQPYCRCPCSLTFVSTSVNTHSRMNVTKSNSHLPAQRQEQTRRQKPKSYQLAERKT